MVIKSVISLFFIFILSSVVYANDSAIVVFDGSGSMKAQVDGKQKIAIAREVMGSLMQDWNEDIDLGLMVYGHRTKACDDIEMVVPVGKPDPATLVNAINAIAPKGETPIGASLKQAAEQLNYVESPTTVILISDGEESCNSDPCAVAKELEKSGVNFTAHVIGFDVGGAKQAKAQAQLKCVAESTGGKFFEAKDSAGLKTALAETAKTVAAPPTPEPKPAVSAETGVKLSAVPVAGAEPFVKDYDVWFYVYEAKQDMDGKRKQVNSSPDHNPFFKLAAGNYVVAVERGNVRIETPLEVKVGETVEHTFVLNAGNMKLKALPVAGAEPFAKDYDVWFYVYEARQDMDGKRKEVNSSPGYNPLFKLAAGNYVVAAQRGNVWIEAPLEVNAGETVEHTFVLNAGNLKLKALPEAGAEPFAKDYDVWFYVYEAKQDMDGKRKEVNSSPGYNPLFKLSAGNYVVAAERKGVRVEAPVEVKSGELVEHTLILSATNPADTKQQTPADKCSQATSCKDCNAVPSCGFCTGTNACLDDQQVAQCTGDFQSTIASCHDCSPHQDESSCSRDAYCGWNNQTQRCFNTDNPH